MSPQSISVHPSNILLLLLLFTSVYAKQPGISKPLSSFPLVLHTDPSPLEQISAGGSTGAILNLNEFEDAYADNIKSGSDLKERKPINCTENETVAQTSAPNSEKFAICDENPTSTEYFDEERNKKSLRENSPDVVRDTLRRKKGLFRRKKKLDSSGSASGIARKLKVKKLL